MNAVTTLVLPIVTIVGVIVLMALGKVDQSTGIALISALAGGHLGAAVATNSATKAVETAPVATTTTSPIV